jgi:MOSC domain-containing protein YiiM
MGGVVGLYVSPGIGERMQPRAAVQALAGRGLEGDRYAMGLGSYSRVARHAVRHVSLIARESIAAANKELVERGLMPFEPDETRRNIIVEGADVYALLGQEFRIGAVRLRGIEPTRPCQIPSVAANKTGFREAYHGRGGVRAEVLSDGSISIGDALIRAGTTGFDDCRGRTAKFPE